MLVKGMRTTSLSPKRQVNSSYLRSDVNHNDNDTKPYSAQNTTCEDSSGDCKSHDITASGSLVVDLSRRQVLTDSLFEPPQHYNTVSLCLSFSFKCALIIYGGTVLYVLHGIEQNPTHDRILVYEEGGWAHTIQEQTIHIIIISTNGCRHFLLSRRVKNPAKNENYSFLSTFSLHSWKNQSRPEIVILQLREAHGWLDLSRQQWFDSKSVVENGRYKYIERLNRKLSIHRGTFMLSPCRRIFYLEVARVFSPQYFQRKGFKTFIL